MTTIDDYLKMNYPIEVVKDEFEDGYVLSIPLLKGCITTSETIEEGMTMIEDAKREWIKAAVEEGFKVPEPVDSNQCTSE
jgi:predicted RNase H-like HicB family nuclease